MLGRVAEVSARTRHARELFAPLGPTYDRYARLLSFGQDPRWRALPRLAHPGETRRACSTSPPARRPSRSSSRARVPARDGDRHRPERGDARRRPRARRRGRARDRIELREGRAESLPFADAEFDALTFTYLLRYVDDPAATMRELARVVRPGGTIAMLEFGVPRGVWRPLWELYVRVGLPARRRGRRRRRGARSAASSGRAFAASTSAYPVGACSSSGATPGSRDVHARRLSLGGGIVVWGTRA